jgi:hypothetical protein
VKGAAWSRAAVFLFSVAASLAAASVSAASGPKIVLSENSVDLGMRINDEAAGHRFEIKNAGNEPLVVRVTTTSCGCVYHDDIRAPIPPGETAWLESGYKPRSDSRRLGTQNFSLVLETNDTTLPAVTLEVKMELMEAVTLRPTVLDLDEKTKSGTFEVIRMGKDGEIPTITSVSPSAPEVQVKEVSSTSEGAVGITTYSVTHSGNELRDSTIKVTTSSARMPILELPLQHTVADSVVFSPKRVAVGVLTAGSTVRRRVNFTSAGDLKAPLSFESDHPNLTVLECAFADGVGSMEVQFRADTPGKMNLRANLLDAANFKVGSIQILAVVRE